MVVAVARLRRPDGDAGRTARRGRGRRPRQRCRDRGRRHDRGGRVGGLRPDQSRAARPAGRTRLPGRGREPAHHRGRQRRLTGRAAVGGPRWRPCCWPGSPARRPAPPSRTCCWAGPSLAAGCPPPGRWPRPTARCWTSHRRRACCAYDEGVFIGYRAWERRHRLAALRLRARARVHDLGIRGPDRRRRPRCASPCATPAPGPAARSSRSTPGRSAADASRPRRWLAGFAAATAAPGETATVTVPLPERTWQIWAEGWTTRPGDYTIEAAHSLRRCAPRDDCHHRLTGAGPAGARSGNADDRDRAARAGSGRPVWRARRGRPAAAAGPGSGGC